jgi:hypothetical protein
MKKLFVFVLASMMFTQFAYASDYHIQPITGDHWGHKPCPKPPPCPECPKPPKAAPEVESRHSEAEHAAFAGFLSTAAYKTFRVNRLKKKHSYVAAVALATLASQALEPERGAQKQTLNASLLGAALTPLLVFDF